MKPLIAVLLVLCLAATAAFGVVAILTQWTETLRVCYVFGCLTVVHLLVLCAVWNNDRTIQREDDA